jgi:membrane-associated HD superfamily phosphohydrolase
METDKLSPEKSLELITQVITQARDKFEENGFIYMFWGALITITSISQFVLLKNEYYNINWYPYLLMPIGAIYSTIYFSKKKRKNKQNLISKILSALWIVLSINMMLLGFLFANNLKENLIPIILILLSIGIIVSGTSVKSKLLLYSGIFIALSAFLGFYLEWIFQPLLMGVVSIITILIPGIILMVQHKKKENV